MKLVTAICAFVSAMILSTTATGVMAEAILTAPADYTFTFRGGCADCGGAVTRQTL